MIKLLKGDCLKRLRKLPANSIDSVVTDPPYGLSKEPNVAEVMQHWLNGDVYKHHSNGFMGKSWDSFVPGPEYWREVYRVLKPGGHALVFSSSRTHDLMGVALRFAGLEVRDTITWHMGSGFPKSLNVSKAIDREAGAKRKVVGKKAHTSQDTRGNPISGTGGRGPGLGQNKPRLALDITAPATNSAKQWQGFGSALKPSTEFILMVRKPLAEKTLAANVQKYGTGAINIDASRVKAATPRPTGLKRDGTRSQKVGNDGWDRPWKQGKQRVEPNAAPMTSQGRWPSNLILSHHELCKRKGLKKVKSASGGDNRKGGFAKSYVGGKSKTRFALASEHHVDGTETVENWVCHESCPVRMLDEQSGVSKSPPIGSVANVKAHKGFEGKSFAIRDRVSPNGHGDSGGASRFFYVAKASRRERNAGLEGMPKSRTNRMMTGSGKVSANMERFSSDSQNHHPTVKPIALMQYLVRLITPPGGTVLDCFAGSGSTGCAAISQGFEFIGIELDATYLKIARNRIDYWKRKLKRTEKRTKARKAA